MGIPQREVHLACDIIDTFQPIFSSLTLSTFCPSYITLRIHRQTAIGLLLSFAKEISLLSLTYSLPSR